MKSIDSQCILLASDGAIKVVRNFRSIACAELRGMIYIAAKFKATPQLITPV